MRIAIGIDTGGTCTDAVLYELGTNRVLGQSKALTTHTDLSQGILAALDGLDPALRQQAESAGLSTTLATNACVEGKFRKTRLLLMGIDRTGVARYGAEYGFTDPDGLRYLPCRTTITGQVLEEPDWDVLRSHAREWPAHRLRKPAVQRLILPGTRGKRRPERRPSPGHPGIPFGGCDRFPCAGHPRANVHCPLGRAAHGAFLHRRARRRDAAFRACRIGAGRLGADRA